MEPTEKNVRIDISQGTMEFPEKALTSDEIPMPEFTKWRKSKTMEIYADAEFWKIIDERVTEIKASFDDLISDKVEKDTNDTDDEGDDIECDENDNIENEQSSDDWYDDYDYDPID